MDLDEELLALADGDSDEEPSQVQSATKIGSLSPASSPGEAAYDAHKRAEPKKGKPRARAGKSKGTRSDDEDAWVSHLTMQLRR